jgi:hypothetical protein
LYIFLELVVTIKPLLTKGKIVAGKDQTDNIENMSVVAVIIQNLVKRVQEKIWAMNIKVCTYYLLSKHPTLEQFKRLRATAP